MAARTPQCALHTMQKLAWAYLVRASAGDFGRSSVVLAKFAQTYPGLRAQIASTTGVAPASLPPRIDEYFSELTASMLGFVLSAAALDAEGRVANPALREAALQIRTRTAANVGELFNTRISPVVPQGSNLRAFESISTQHEAEHLAIALDGAIAESIECAESASTFDNMIANLATQTRDAVQSARGAVELPEVRISARSGQAGTPAWLLYGAGALALGIAGWAVWKAAA